MNKQVKNIVVLVAICVTAALLMAGINMITAPIIEENELAEANKALVVVLPDGKDFEKINISEYSLPATVTGAHKETNGAGYVIELETTGYKPGMKLMCGIDGNGEVKGAICLSSSETNGAEKNYGNSLVGTKLDTIDAVDTVAGSTKTTEAYRNAIKDAMNAAIILGGGTVDIRDEEQILLDNLKAALPSANGEFEQVFITEDLVGVKYIYSAKNNTGFVYVLGETFVGINSEGNIIGAFGEENTQKVLSAYAQMSASRLTEIDVSGMGLSSSILKVSKTDSGNYVFELRAAGYGINGDRYTASGEYIYIKLAATKDGKIISIKTTAESETEGIGSACADKDFYEQFIGKTESNYQDIDAISGATVTTNGYKTAVLRALQAVKALEGK